MEAAVLIDMMALLGSRIGIMIKLMMVVDCYMFNT